MCKAFQFFPDDCFTLDIHLIVAACVVFVEVNQRRHFDYHPFCTAGHFQHHCCHHKEKQLPIPGDVAVSPENKHSLCKCAATFYA